IKKNYFIGIRTPWTIESEEVWDITHKRAKYAFIVGGIIMIIGGMFESLTVWFFPVSILALLWPVVDSYFIHRRVVKNDKG
ncbi:SdpI family protein, partial [bacterium]